MFHDSLLDHRDSRTQGLQEALGDQRGCCSQYLGQQSVVFRFLGVDWFDSKTKGFGFDPQSQNAYMLCLLNY